LSEFGHFYHGEFGHFYHGEFGHFYHGEIGQPPNEWGPIVMYNELAH